MCKVFISTDKRRKTRRFCFATSAGRCTPLSLPSLLGTLILFFDRQSTNSDPKLFKGHCLFYSRAVSGILFSPVTFLQREAGDSNLQVSVIFNGSTCSDASPQFSVGVSVESFEITVNDSVSGHFLDEPIPEVKQSGQEVSRSVQFGAKPCQSVSCKERRFL